MSKEAMTLALEALQVSVSCTDMYYVPLGKSMIPEVEEAIKALEEALAKQEQSKPVACAWICDGKIVNAFPHPPSTPEIWAIKNKDGYWTSRKFSEAPLYTTPQPAQKPWVGLTDEEINDLVHSHDDFAGLWEFADSVEAKLKGKNT
jgi:hypothetical protein